MKKIILGATFVAIAALVGSPILAEAVLPDLKGARAAMWSGDGTINGLVFKAPDGVVIPTDGSVFGGYATPLQNGDYIAVTSHPGLLDSISQTDANDPVWHTHLVKASTNASCADLGIDALSFGDPSRHMKVASGGSTILTQIIANGTASYTDVVSNSTVEFTVGTPMGYTDGWSFSNIDHIAFDLSTAADGTNCLDVLSSGTAVPMAGL